MTQADAITSVTPANKLANSTQSICQRDANKKPATAVMVFVSVRSGLVSR